jgi:hypothetical protein
MSSTAAVQKILCQECQRENEAERVYCHDCGARLDRSAVVIKKEPPVDVRKRVRKMFDPTRARIRAGFFKTSKTILGAAAAAALAVMLLPPELPEPQKTEVLASLVRIDMETALEKHQTTPLEFTQDQVNAYLASALKTKKKALDKPFLDFSRAIIEFKEGNCSITTERSFSGYLPLHASLSYTVSLNSGKIVATNTGGAIGRLQLHPKLSEHLGLIFGDIWTALDRDTKLLTRFAALQLHDKRVALTAVAQPPQ